MLLFTPQHEMVLLALTKLAIMVPTEKKQKEGWFFNQPNTFTNFIYTNIFTLTNDLPTYL